MGETALATVEKATLQAVGEGGLSFRDMAEVASISPQSYYSFVSGAAA